MNAIQAVRDYYSLFGTRGVLLAAKARLLRKLMGVEVSIPGIKHSVCVRLRTSDVSVLRQVFVLAEYDCEFSKSPRLIIDAGANIGLTSVFYANKYPEARIIAIEPEQSNFQLLRQNAAPYPKITPIQAALWNNDMELDLFDPGLGHYGFQTNAKPEAKLAIGCCSKVRGITMDKLIKEYALDFIDILKMDIEGSESEVFQNSASWIEKIGVVVIELHDRIRAGCSESFHGASKSFRLVMEKGETLFLARKEYFPGSPLPRTQMSGSPAFDSTKMSDSIKCKIIGEFN
jgi:FkbM family methyltransferase